MGCIFDEKHREHRRDGGERREDERFLFRLVLYSDPADEPTVTVKRQHRTEDGWQTGEVEWVRHFDREGFNESHYDNFRRKFARDPEYRNRWTT
jgi:hypothetical protein